MKNQSIIGALALGLAAVTNTQAVQLFERIDSGGQPGAIALKLFLDSNTEPFFAITQSAAYPLPNVYPTPSTVIIRKEDEPELFGYFTDGVSDELTWLTSVHPDVIGGGGGGNVESIFFGTPGTDLIGQDFDYLRFDFVALGLTVISGHSDDTPTPDGGATAALLALGTLGLVAVRRQH